MRTYDDDLDDDLFDGDDDELDTPVRGKAPAGRKGASASDSLADKYSDYLMWRDTGSSHDEALDLANMTEDEYAEAEADENPDGGSRFGDDDDDDFDDEDSYEAQRRSRRGGRDDDDDY